MSMDYICIGPCPPNEDCAQVGSADYYKRAQIECKAYRKQLIEEVGEPPEGCRLIIKGFEHEFGTYYEVIAKFEEDNEEAVDYALKCESSGPEKWNEKARRELAEALAPYAG